MESSIGKKDIHIQSDILLVDEELAWHHFSTAAALRSGVLVVQLFAEAYVETTKKNLSRTSTRYLPLANYQIRFLVNNTRQTKTLLCHAFLTAINNCLS